MLHLCTFKTPTLWAVMSERGDADYAFQMRNGLKGVKNQIPVIGGKAHPEYSKYPYQIFGGPRNGRATTAMQLDEIVENLKLHFTDRDNAAIKLFVYQNGSKPGRKNYSYFSQIVGSPLNP